MTHPDCRGKSGAMRAQRPHPETLTPRDPCTPNPSGPTPSLFKFSLVSLVEFTWQRPCHPSRPESRSPSASTTPSGPWCSTTHTCRTATPVKPNNVLCPAAARWQRGHEHRYACGVPAEPGVTAKCSPANSREPVGLLHPTPTHQHPATQVSPLPMLTPRPPCRKFTAWHTCHNRTCQTRCLRAGTRSLPPGSPA